MVDIVGDDRPATRHFVPHKFSGDIVGDFRAEALTIADIFGKARTAEIFAFRHIFHLGRDDAATGIVHLADIHARLGAQHLLADIGERRDAAAAVGAELAIIFGADFALGDFLDIAPGADPILADFRETGADVDKGVGVRIGTAGVIHTYGLLPAGRFQMDFAHRHAALANIDFLAAANRASGNADFGACGDVCHVSHSIKPERGRHRVKPLPPSAGVNRIRFSGSQGVTPASQSHDSPGMVG